MVELKWREFFPLKRRKVWALVPITLPEREGSFSTLRRLKTHSRVAMSSKRLPALALFLVYSFPSPCFTPIALVSCLAEKSRSAHLATSFKGKSAARK